MAGDGGMYRQAPIVHAVDARLGPAEAHDLIRQRLARVAGQWGLTPADVHRLARQMRMHTYAPGEIILPRGVHADCLGLVVRGQVAVQVGQRGSARLVVVLLPGSTFGEMMLADGRPNNATLQALTHCELWFLRRADLQIVTTQRKTERQVSTLWQLVKGSAVLLAAILVVVLMMSLPVSREAFALVPMGVGQWCGDTGREVCAQQAWQVAVNLAPTDLNPHLALGNLYFRSGNIAAAEQSFEAAKALAPDSPEAHNNLGLIYAWQGDHEQAIAAFRRALELEPGVATTEENLALSLQATQQYEEALQHYQAALALAEPRASTLTNVAIAYFETGQPDKAEEAAWAALGLNPALAPAYVLLGAVALESRHPERALPSLQRAAALDPNYDQTYFYLGLAHKSLDQPTEAIAAFEQALIYADDQVTRVRIRRHLGELYEMQEQGTAH